MKLGGLSIILKNPINNLIICQKWKHQPSGSTKNWEKFQWAFPNTPSLNSSNGAKVHINTSSSPSHLGKLSVWNEAKAIHQEIWEWISRSQEFPLKANTVISTEPAGAPVGNHPPLSCQEPKNPFNFWPSMHHLGMPPPGVFKETSNL